MHLSGSRQHYIIITNAIPSDRYLSETLPHKPRNKDKRHLTQRLCWWKEQIGSLSIVKVTPDVIADHKARLLASVNRYSKPLTPATVNSYLAALSAVLKTAKNEWRWIDANPVGNVGKGPESRGRDRFLSADERGWLLDACRESRSEFLYIAVVLALSTGMRKGEILSLTWDCVDLKRGRIRIRDPKNSEQRTVGLSGLALELVINLAKIRRIDTDRAGLENFRFHDLRHTTGAELLMSGASLGELAQVLGHRSLQMVRRYNHLTEDHAAAVLERMNAKIF